MNRVKVKDYNSLKSGTPIEVDILGFKQDGERLLLGPVERAKGILIRCRSKDRDIYGEDGKKTGKQETVGDTLVFEKRDADMNKIPQYHYTVCGCGLFQVYK
jgi:hypothetical protein